MTKNNTYLRQVEGGDTIKQGDHSSVLGFELLDENEKAIEGLTGPAMVRLASGEQLWETEGTLEGNKVTFTIHDVLPASKYELEIELDGYIFPSDKTVRIQVTKSLGKLVPEEVARLERVQIAEEVKRQLADRPGLTMEEVEVAINQSKGAGYDDRALVGRVEALESKVDKDTVYDDRELRDKLTVLENKADVDLSSYTRRDELPNVSVFVTKDEAATMQGKVGTLEQKLGEVEGKNGSLDGRISTLESKNDTLDVRVSTLESADLINKVQILESDKASLLSQVDDLRGRFDDVVSRLSSLENQ